MKVTKTILCLAFTAAAAAQSIEKLL